MPQDILSYMGTDATARCFWPTPKLDHQVRFLRHAQLASILYCHTDLTNLFGCAPTHHVGAMLAVGAYEVTKYL